MSQAKDESGKEVKDYWKPSVALLNDRCDQGYCNCSGINNKTETCTMRRL